MVKSYKRPFTPSVVRQVVPCQNWYGQTIYMADLVTIDDLAIGLARPPMAIMDGWFCRRWS